MRPTDRPTERPAAACGEDISTALTNCDAGPFEPMENTQFVICTNECDECVIRCDTKQQCEELIIVSGAGNFVLECTEEQACTKVRTFVGEISQATLNNIGLGSCNSDEFFRDNYGDALVECFAKQACEGSDTLFRFIGEFNEVCITADNDPDRNDDTNEDRIKDAMIVVDIGEGSFKIDCGPFNDNKNCDSTNVDCDSGDCMCQGQCGQANLMGVDIAAHKSQTLNIVSSNMDQIKAVIDGYLFYICIAFSLGMIMCCIGAALYYIIYKKKSSKNKYQRIKLDSTSAASSTATSEISDINF